MILITIGIGLSMLNIENVQLITGPVAYLLILLGCIQMKQEGQSFKKTIPYAAVMLGLQLLVVVLSVISVTAALSIDLGSITDASSLSMLDGRQQIIIIVIALIYAVAVMVLDLMITYRLTKGVQELQINTGADLKGDLLLKLWKAFSIMIVVSIVFIIIAAMYRGLILAAFIALAAAIVKIVYFGYFIRACVYYQKNRSIA